MANKVVSKNEVYLDGTYYPVSRPVQSVLASIYPAKVIIGDTTRDSQIRSSVIAWSDWRGGLGINRMEGAGDIDRAWWSECQLRYRNHLVMPGKAEITASVSHGISNAKIGAIGELNDEVYVAWNGTASDTPKLFKYNNTTDAWGSAVTASGLVDQVTDVLNFTDRAGTTFLLFAHYDAGGSGYTYSSDGTNWYSDNQATQYVTFWDERLWGISYAGQLWYISTALNTSSNNQNTEVTEAKLPLPDGYITGLFVARDASGEPIIYASTKKGLWAHDAANARFVETQLGLPFHPDAGKGTLRWRDSVYIPSGLGIYKYINGSTQAVVTITGPDRDDGLPSDKRGSIKHMDATHNELLAAVDATTAPNITSGDAIPYQWASHQGADVIDSDTGYSTILGYNELGWETKWISPTAGRGIDSIAVNNAYDDYRMWWGFNDRVYFMTMPSNIINPSEIANFHYASGTASHETPWFNAGQSEVDKLALKAKVEVTDTTSDALDDANDYVRSVALQYATDYNESYTTLGTITSDGITTYTFGSNLGTAFRAIKFKLTLTREAGGDDTDENQLKLTSPDVVSTTLEFRKKLEAKWGHQVQLDLNKSYKGNTPKQLRGNLVSAIESTTLVEFTFRDDDGGTRNYYVDVTSATGLENTGYDEGGFSTIAVVEP